MDAMLLPFVPRRVLHKSVKDSLSNSAQLFVSTWERRVFIRWGTSIAVSLPADVGDAVLTQVDRIGVVSVQPAAVVAQDLQSILSDVDGEQLTLEPIIEIEWQILAGQGEEEVGAVEEWCGRVDVVVEPIATPGILLHLESLLLDEESLTLNIFPELLKSEFLAHNDFSSFS